MHNFEKEAQKRSVTRMLGNALNPMEHVRQMVSPKYKRMISSIDYIDRVMRYHMIRLKPTLRDYLHQARMAFKNRDFRKVFLYTKSILDSVDSIFINQMNELEVLEQELKAEFSKDTTDEFERGQIEKSFGVPKSSAVEFNDLVIEAGITQWIKEHTPTGKEIEGTLFDKIFQNMQGKQQEAARQSLALADRTYNFIKEIFDNLDRNRRNIVEYVKLAKDYHIKLEIEKDKLKRNYLNFFPPQASSEIKPEIVVSTPSVIEPTPSESISSEPTLEVVPEANELVNRAKMAFLIGDIGIGIALLVKASELYDLAGDEYQSIKLLKTAIKLGK